MKSVRLVARLGGFLARKGDGEPGVKTIWLGACSASSTSPLASASLRSFWLRGVVYNEMLPTLTRAACLCLLSAWNDGKCWVVGEVCIH